MTVELDELINSTVDDLDFDEALTQLVDLRKIIGDLKVVESLLEQRVGETMPMREKAVPGVGVVSKSHAKVRDKWDIEPLIHIVAARCADDAYDTETAELMPRGALVEMVAERIRECFGISYGKKTGLRKFGVNFSDFYEAEYDSERWKVRIQ